MTNMTDEQRKAPLEHAPWDEPREAHADHPLPEPCAHTVEAAKEFSAESAIPPEELERLTQGIIGALKTVYDPEIPVDIYELGLIYKIDVNDDREVDVEMTLTAPACPWQARCRCGWKTQLVRSRE